MKTKLFLTVAILTCCVCTTQAQPGNVFLSQTFKAIMPDGGTVAERDSLLTYWIDNVTKKNDKILHQYNYRHYFTQDSRDWILVTEYKSIADYEVADSINNQLASKLWSDPKKRAEFNKKLGRYFEPMHGDELYRILPKFTK